MESIIIKVGEKDYTVSFPNVEQMLEIEATKNALTNGKYIDFTMSLMKTHVYLLDIADAVGYLSVLIPELKKDLGVENWRGVDPKVLKPIVKAYKETFIPWYKGLFDDLYSYDSEEKDEQSKKKA